VLSQTFQNFEVLIIDDGSTDHTGRICEDYKRKEPRISVIHTKNYGVSNARNVGIQNAKGKYITFVDSDDWLSGDFLAALYFQIGDADFISCDFAEEYEKGATVREYSHFLTENGIDHSTLDFYKDCISCKLYTYVVWGKVFRRDVIGKITFQNFAYSEDAYFIREIAAKCHSYKLVAKKAYHYFINSGGVTSDSNRLIEQQGGAVLMLMKTRELIETLGFLYLLDASTELLNSNIYRYIALCVKKLNFKKDNFYSAICKYIIENKSSIDPKYYYAGRLLCLLKRI
jgi:glycosyltransferase involved in cell wall biosynthesis